MQKKLGLPAIFVVLLLNACSSNPPPEVVVNEDGSTEEPLKPQESPAQPATSAPSAAAATSDSPTTGLLSFFNGGDKGLVVTNMRWGRPLTSENPGADCELRSRSPGVFACVVKQQKDAVVLTITETQKADSRALAKITLDGKGAATRDRWLSTLRQNGYGVVSETPGPKLSRTVLQLQGTRAEAIWVPAKAAITLLFRAAPVEKEKAAATESPR